MGRWDKKDHQQIISMTKSRFIQMLAMMGIIGLCTGVLVAINLK